MCSNEIFGKVRKGKLLQMFLTKMGSRRRSFFNFALKYTIREVQRNQGVLKLNGTHQLLAYAEGMNQL
jgi:hypothetical protein